MTLPDLNTNNKSDALMVRIVGRKALQVRELYSPPKLKQAKTAPSRFLMKKSLFLTKTRNR